ncbi:hypothetical protein Esi_0000_0052 [Ectocarpus siliculosus]|uniref:Uncharacterized protein n=1 Tax=Ectocarpus siliculosus TaxID=2880 RepID=D8LAV7_ECTSI|nr:hypothetical protein Esi_0000_0052 [Ectocarpus siliculosus]|eukprot:CBN76466.1 hypothetical protein Esi_0000_0052 [Ectocarpus siliculosus]
MSSRGGPQQGLRAEQLNSPYKRASHSGTFGGVPGDKENAGAEARAAAVAEGKLAVEVSHHLKGALSPGVRGTQWQHYHQPSTPSRANNVPSTPPSIPFTGSAAETATAAAAAGRAGSGAGGAVLPLSPSATAARSMNALGHSTFDRGTGFSLSAARRVSVRAVRARSGSGSGGGGGDGFTHAHSPAVVLRVPQGRPTSARKLMAGGRREALERGDLELDVAEVSPSPKRSSNDSERKAPFSSCESETPKRGRSPSVAAAGLTLLPPISCDEAVSWEFEAKARRRSAVRNAKTAAELFDSNSSTCCVTPAGGDGDGVGDSGGSVGGRWRKLQARGGGGSAGPPRLKLSVESAVAAAGEDDEVLLSPCCHGPVDLPAFCASPILVPSSGVRSGGGGGGRPLRGGAEENVLTSSVDSAWSMGSIDETAAREPSNTRNNDRASGGDPVARMLLSQSDDYDVGGVGFGVTPPHGPDGGGSSNASDSPGLSRMKSAPSFVQHYRHYHHRRLHQPSPTAGTTVTFSTLTPKRKGDSPFSFERDASGCGNVAVAAEGDRGGKDAALLPSPRRDGGGGALPPALVRTATASPRAFSVASATGGGSAARDLREAGARGSDFGAKIGGSGGRGRLLNPVEFRLHCPGDLEEQSEREPDVDR